MYTGNRQGSWKGHSSAELRANRWECGTPGKDTTTHVDSHTHTAGMYTCLPATLEMWEKMQYLCIGSLLLHTILLHVVQCETHKRLNRFTCYRALEYAHSISINTVLRPRDSRLKPSENSTFTTYIQRTANTHIHVPSGYSIHCTATITAIAVCVV